MLDFLKSVVDKDETYSCEDCNYFSSVPGGWCDLWDVHVDEPNNSHCESANIGQR